MSGIKPRTLGVLRVVHPEEPFKCAGCGKDFANVPDDRRADAIAYHGLLHLVAEQSNAMRVAHDALVSIRGLIGCFDISDTDIRERAESARAALAPFLLDAEPVQVEPPQ